MKKYPKGEIRFTMIWKRSLGSDRWQRSSHAVGRDALEDFLKPLPEKADLGSASERVSIHFKWLYKNLFVDDGDQCGRV